MSVTPTGTFAEYLRPLGPYMPPQLISPAAFESMQSTTQLIPGALAMSMFTFECSLNKEEAVANFQLQANAALNARQTLAQAIAGGNMLLRNNPVWQRIYDFVEVWSYEGSALNRFVRNIRLEFDTAGSAREVPAPGLYFGLQDGDVSQGAESSDSAQLAAVCLKALTLIKGQQVPKATAAAITDAILSIPPAGRLSFVGALQGSRSPAYRLIIDGLDSASIPTYLEKFDWSGSLADLNGTLAATSGLCDYLSFSVDIEGDMPGVIALECYYNNMAQPSEDTRWGELLDYLGAHEMCLPPKREGLLAYPGVISASASGMLWPESLRLLSYALGPHSLDTCTMSLHHIKLEFAPDRAPQAKAYLAAYYA